MSLRGDYNFQYFRSLVSGESLSVKLETLLLYLFLYFTRNYRLRFAPTLQKMMIHQRPVYHKGSAQRGLLLLLS